MSGFRLGKSFGINVHIDWSWLFIFTPVTWSPVSTFRQVHPDRIVGLLHRKDIVRWLELQSHSG